MASSKSGATKGTHYVLPGSPASRPRQAAAPVGPAGGAAGRTYDAPMKASATDHGQLVLDLARRGRVTNEVVRDLLAVGSEEARRLLVALTEEGVLERRGAKRGTHYVAQSDTQEPAAPSAARSAPDRRLSVKELNALKAEFARRLQRDLQEVTGRSGYRPAYYQRMLIENG